MPVTEEGASSKSSEETPGIPSPTSQNNINSPSSNIRRYLVLLQDCLAIKFVSIDQLHQKRIQQESSVKSHSNFPIPSSSSTGCCHCLCSDDVGIVSAGNNIHSGGSCRTTVASSIANNPCDTCNNNGSQSRASSCSNKGRKWDCKSNNHKPPSNVGSNDRGDHQECQFYRHQANQMNYPHHEDSSQSQSSSVKGSGNGSGGIIPTGDEVNHQTQLLINNKSNKSASSANNNKGDYDVVGNGKQCCGCSPPAHPTEWESVQQRQHQQQMDSYLKKQHQHQGPAHHYDYLSQPNNYQSHPKGTSALKDAPAYSVNNNICRSTKPESGGASMMNKVDHSMQALFLYKEFLEINLQCFWNSALHEAFKNLQYKGSVVPSTIIVGSTIRKHLTVLKTAWTRKMLKSPTGFIIDFLGEIEELIADPIAKSHFVPLSDSLCWSIHELTSSGQEAFVDDIFLSLASAFPGMALPTKELIYQTLEKLTRERKIYQTAQGYFVVTPDTHRYIMSTEPLLIQASRADSHTNTEVANFLRNSILEKASTLPPPPTKSSLSPRTESPDEDNGDENDIPDSRKESSSPDPDTYSLPYGTFKRYNSLRIRKQDKSGTTGCLPRRTLSMRLPKSKSKSGSKALGCNSPTIDQQSKRADVTGSFQNLDTSQPVSTVNEQLITRRRKHKSFLSRLLSFRGVRKNSSRKDKSGRGNNANKAQTNVRDDKTSNAPISSEGNNECAAEENGAKTKSSSGRKASTLATTNLATISTQTSFSIENLNADLGLLSLAPTSKSSTLEREDSDSGRCTDSHSDADAEITAALNRGLTPIMHSGRRRDGGSHSSCNVYEKIESDLGLKVDIDECDGRSPRSPSSQMSVSPSPSTFTTASNLCRGNRHNLYSRCHSSASSTGYSYRDFYNLYRRRYPSYQQSTPTSLESAELNEGLKFKPQQPIRYPPRSFERKQIFDEISRSSFKDKKNRKTVSISNNVSSIDNGKLSRAGQHDSSECIVNMHNNDNNNSIQTSVNGSASSSSSTTTFTQTLKNSTNLELEFRLPLGSILSAAMGGGNVASTKKASSTDKLSSERSQQYNESSLKSEMEETERTLSEVNTMVNDLFTIKSFVKTNPFNDELSSTIEFKTRGNAGKFHNNGGSKPNYVIETVSSKPFGDIHTKYHRESEII